MSGNYYIYCILKEYVIKNETLEKRKIDFYVHGKKVWNNLKYFTFNYIILLSSYNYFHINIIFWIIMKLCFYIFLKIVIKNHKKKNDY